MICSKSRPKTMDETNVLELHFFKKKKIKIQNLLHAGGASSLASVGGGKVLVSSSILTSSELVWRRELVAAPRLSFIALKSRLGKFSAASSLKSLNLAA